MTSVYDPERVSRLAQISTKFHAHAAPGDKIHLGIEGDDQMPAKYRGNRPTGTVVKVKNQGTEHSTLRVQLDGSNRQIDLHPFQIAGDRVWEFTEDTWPKVLARSNPDAAQRAYRGSSGNDEIASMRKQMAEMTHRFDKEMAEAKNFNNALVESMHQLTGEIVQVNPNANFSKVFREEYKGMSRHREASPFDSDMESGDES